VSENYFYDLLLRHHSAALRDAYRGGDLGPWKLINTTSFHHARRGIYHKR